MVERFLGRATADFHPAGSIESLHVFRVTFQDLGISLPRLLELSRFLIGFTQAEINIWIAGGNLSQVLVGFDGFLVVVGNLSLVGQNPKLLRGRQVAARVCRLAGIVGGSLVIAQGSVDLA